jgi:hypothetical protein
MDLVTQQDGMRVESFRSKILNADMEGSAFDESWSSLSALLRAQLFIIIPVFVVYLFLFGTREMLAKNIALDDLPSSEEIISEDENFEQLDSLIVDERDRKLIEHIARLEDQQIMNSRQVAIVYGARHMRTTVAFLMQKLNYRVVQAEWVKVFDL